MAEDGGATQQRDRELAERDARHAAQTGDEYDELLAEGARYGSQEDWRRAARAYREAIALRPDGALAYLNLGSVLTNSGHRVEAVQRFLEAKERYPAGSRNWAITTAWAFQTLAVQMEACADVAKPEWWNDEGLKALSARVVRAAPNSVEANQMRALVLCGLNHNAWEVRPRSAADLKEAAIYYERAAALSNAPTVKAGLYRNAVLTRSLADAITSVLETCLLWIPCQWDRRPTGVRRPVRGGQGRRRKNQSQILIPYALQGRCPAARKHRQTGEPGFARRGIAQRPRPLVVRGRLLELYCRARPRLPSTFIIPAQHHSPHDTGWLIARRRPHNPRRQRLELPVVPPLRRDCLGARIHPQHVKGVCRGLCPVLRVHRIALPGLKVSLRELHQVPRVV
eukprot:scaffold129960_cov71-Phaeocystis_antarctica.AAC.2